jgi:hypothetical protein
MSDQSFLWPDMWPIDLGWSNVQYKNIFDTFLLMKWKIDKQHFPIIFCCSKFKVSNLHKFCVFEWPDGVENSEIWKNNEKTMKLTSHAWANQRSKYPT